MRHLSVLIVLPVMLSGLEKVNLIKAGGFERNQEVWNTSTWKNRPYYNDSAIAISHDIENPFSGSFSGSCDTRKDPGSTNQYAINRAILTQGFSYPKILSDIDSLYLRYSIFPLDSGVNLTWLMTISFSLNADEKDFTIACYCYKPLNHPYYISPDSPMTYIDQEYYANDSSWHLASKAVNSDLVSLGIDPDSTTVDSFNLWSDGTNYMPWRGQKVYWDDIRLTGYADYDVGIKGILSRDSTGNAYTPTTRIKNFGRKAADSFLVIAQIAVEMGLDSGTVVYADTLTWSLEADSEDTLSFKEFDPIGVPFYTLTVSTVMTPDESDEDDVMSKTLYGSGVQEQPTPRSLNLNVLSLHAGEKVLQVSCTLPRGEQGTLSLYDPSGRRVERIRVQGEDRVSFKSGPASGVYFVKLTSGKTSITRKAVVLD